MICKVRETITKFNMIKGDSVLVALSGGADSVSLLHVLLCLRDEFGFSVSAAHVNHQLRGAESERDEQFVRSLCEKYSVPLHVLRCDVKSEAEKYGEGVEEYGRRVRYNFFLSLTDGAVATAHTLSDNVETLLLHLTRGSALHGLCGIPPVRDNIVRPLINCTRDDVENYCRENNLSFVTDSTNLCTDYSRNRVRNLVIPELKELNPLLESAVGRCIESLCTDEDYLSKRAEALLENARADNGFYINELREVHPSLKSRVLRLILTEKMKELPQKKHIDSALKVLDGKVSAAEVEKGVSLKSSGGYLYFLGESRGDWSEKVTDGNSVLPFGKAKIEIIYTDCENYIQKINKQDLDNYFSYDKISLNLEFRNRRAGDKMKRANSSCTKSMKKLFEEMKIPSHLRDDVCILTHGDKIVWAENFGCDDEFKITGETKIIAKVKIYRDDEND